MIEKLKSRTITLVCLGVAFLIFLSMCVSAVVFINAGTNIDAQKASINGSYTVDGGDPQKTVKGKTVHCDFSSLDVKGKLSHSIKNDEVLIISAANAWFTLKADDKTVASNRRSEGWYSQTPGYTIHYVSGRDIGGNRDIELQMYDPYKFVSNEKLDDYFDMYVGTKATVYELLLRHKAPMIIFCLLICFFGVFAFPIAAIIMGGIDYKYLSFATLSLFAGIYIALSETYSYLPLWIDNPVLCMVLNESANCLFVGSILIYLKASFTIDKNKATANVLIMFFILSVTVALVLQLFDVIDLFMLKPLFYLLFILCALIMSVCMYKEVRKNRASSAQLVLNWIPIALCVAFDVVNGFIGFTDIRLTEIGIALTLLNQVVHLIFLLKKQYQEKLRYRQMEKELYEARVSVMVSQIQPHFLYNSLTSIAMMCTKNPQKAKEATINFADYLRGNMNSLKETRPVPFTSELEHLKKYLMLEQLRFGDMLKIDYHIETVDFRLPLLTVQPLVENAVKHGVGMKENGGTVTISTLQQEDCFKIIISDNGVGFDTDKTKSDGAKHVGIQNVRQRLKDMCGGRIEINSEPGKGTTAVIIIPKEK